jgi:8-oxo-dGTP diphosphatase
MADSARPLLQVAVGVLADGAGRVLIARRPAGTHAGGFWEFPGGKIGADEPARAGLCRELREELGIRVEAAEPLLVCRHDYPDRSVELHVWRVTEYSGEPRGLEGQPLRWVALDGLMDAGLLPADLPIVDALRAWVSRSSGGSERPC